MPPILPSQPYRGVYLCRMMSVTAGARDKRPWVAENTLWDLLRLICIRVGRYGMLGAVRGARS